MNEKLIDKRIYRWYAYPKSVVEIEIRGGEIVRIGERGIKQNDQRRNRQVCRTRIRNIKKI